RLEPLADNAWLVTLGAGLDPATNRRVHALALRIREAAPPWLVDLVPAHAALGVFYDPARCTGPAVRDWLQATAGEPAAGIPVRPRTVEIPVVYGDCFGPDLAPAAEALGLAPA